MKVRFNPLDDIFNIRHRPHIKLEREFEFDPENIEL